MPEYSDPGIPLHYCEGLLDFLKEEIAQQDQSDSHCNCDDPSQDRGLRVYKFNYVLRVRVGCSA